MILLFALQTFCADYLPETEASAPMVIHNFIIIQVGPTDYSPEFYTRRKLNVKDLKVSIGVSFQVLSIEASKKFNAVQKNVTKL